LQDEFELLFTRTKHSNIQSSCKTVPFLTRQKLQCSCHAQQEINNFYAVGVLVYNALENEFSGPDPGFFERGGC